MDFRYIDIFAGIGGFHIAMRDLGGECVFACEIDGYACETYQKNFGINPTSDIRQVEVEYIPHHEVLCAGFPCQAFSKAGRQNGFEDTRGTLFFDILRILEHHRPKYILLENVRNLVSHDKGNTWRVIHRSLVELGYLIPEKPIIVSPHHLGIPQLRERVFIPGVFREKTDSEELIISIPHKKRHSSFGRIILNNEKTDEYKINHYEEYVLNAWDEFIQGLNQKVIGFPIWSSEFMNGESIEHLPKWKQEFIVKNRKLYQENQQHINSWLEKYNYLKDFVPTHTKFEWQAGTTIRSVWEGIIQFRPSGIRVKRPTEFPALVAMVHIPIIGWEKRRLSPREVANLQGFPPGFIINPNQQQAYKQFGNSVNVEVVKMVARQLLAEDV